MTNQSCLTVKAPAKLNLFLHITGRREDGYHLLQSVFQFLDYGDDIRLCIDESGDISRESDLAGVPPEKDLVVRAARLLHQQTGSALGVRIHVDKRLPMGGGLGGGSSDAASVLVGLNRLWGCGLEKSDLAKLGLQLGADVPVFVHGQAAWAEGVGEKLEPVILSEPWFVVLIPDVNVSTAEIFASVELRRDCPPITIRDFLEGQGRNVCEAPVCARYPQVASALAALGEYAEARMTGTGACVFASFTTEAEAGRAWSALSSRWNGFVARGLNHSPLYEK